MTSGLAWLNDLMEWLGRWVPRIVLIESTHRGVRFGPRGDAKEVGPGLVIYWPITHSIVNMPITTQSVQLSTQLLPCDALAGELLPRVSILGAAVQFRVTHAVHAATKALNLHAVIDNRASAAIAKHQSAGDPRDWSDVVRQELSADMSEYGVTVERLDFTHIGVGVALKNLADWSYGDSQEGKRPS